MRLGFTDAVVFVNDNLVNLDSLTSDNVVAKAIYEVFRVVAGKPLFIEGHVKRLIGSLNKSGIQYANHEVKELKTQVKKLCEANDKYFGNIELRISVNKQGEINKYLGFIPHFYPEPTTYIEGIYTKTLKVVRKNPGIKAKNSDARKIANAFLSKQKLYEVLLVNDNDEITEGSRSNLFLIKDDKVYTAPDEIVLQGITRLKVFKALKNLGIEMINYPIKLNELNSFQSAFICGTSPGVLPLKQINNVKLDISNSILRSIIQEYNNIVSKYLSDY